MSPAMANPRFRPVATAKDASHEAEHACDEKSKPACASDNFMQQVGRCRSESGDGTQPEELTLGAVARLGLVLHVLDIGRQDELVVWDDAVVRLGDLTAGHVQVSGAQAGRVQANIIYPTPPGAATDVDTARIDGVVVNRSLIVLPAESNNCPTTFPSC